MGYGRSNSRVSKRQNGSKSACRANRWRRLVGDLEYRDFVRDSVLSRSVMGPLGNLQNSRDRFSIDPNSQMAPGDTTVEPTPILGALVVVRRFPFGLDPTLLFEPMQRGV